MKCVLSIFALSRAAFFLKSFRSHELLLNHLQSTLDAERLFSGHATMTFVTSLVFL